MFGFWKKKKVPDKLPSNPGIGTEAKVAFANGERTWSEEVNLISVAQTVLKGLGHTVKREEAWLEHPQSRFVLLPELVELQPLEGGGVRTVTTIQANHPTLAPRGVFEFQHSAGDTVEDAISKGFEAWAQSDFVALLESLRPKPETCMTLQMEFPATDRAPARVRRAILGPVMHFRQNPPEEDAAGDTRQAGNSGDPSEHDFCPCCLLTRSFMAFKELMEGDGLFGIRLFAARYEDRLPQADCRVNGEDWPKGAQALREYANTWSDAGVEFRKQYVILQTIDKIPTSVGS